MWVVMMFTAGGDQYEYTVIPSSENPTISEVVALAVQSHMLNLLSGIVQLRTDGGSRLTEVLVMTSMTRLPGLPLAG